ncbi:APC family permease [archaeon]|nr:MAG: APC family permease [archaeon]
MITYHSTHKFIIILLLLFRLGGFYGYARCTLGPFWGYFIGCSGLIESTFYLAASILLLGRAVCAAFDFSSVHEPAWWCICFLYVMGFHAQGGSIIRKFMAVCCIISMSIILIYLLGSIPHLNFTKYALITHKSGFTGTTKDFFIILRLPAWFFIGIDLLSLTSREVKKPSKVIPKAMLCVLGTMIVICAWVIVSVVSQAPGATADVLARKSLFPLSFGFVNIFNISYSDGAIFSIVPLFASCVGYMFIVGRQMHSMAMSGLLPDVCRITYGEDFTPIVNMVITTLVCMVALVFAWLFNPYLLLFRMAVIGGCVVYIAMFACYILFSIRYSSMERSYRNPFGVYGAAAGIVIFTIVLISVLALQPVFEATVSYVVLMLLAIVYYFQVVRDRQFFSEDEQRLFLRAYVVNGKELLFFLLMHYFASLILF